MAIPLYLAATAAEFPSCVSRCDHLAWMACHFSPYGTGLTNLPKQLPQDSLLILNDRTPVCGHDPKLICRTLLQITEQFHCRGILLDLQRKENPVAAAIAAEAARLPCPVAVSEYYAKDLSCAVFLCSSPLHKPLPEHIAPWKGREIWLEAALGCCEITVTEKGSVFKTTQLPAREKYPFYDEMLQCSYRTEINDAGILFSLHRGRKELDAQLEEAANLGIALAVGLHQELGI